MRYTVPRRAVTGLRIGSVKKSSVRGAAWPGAEVAVIMKRPSLSTGSCYHIDIVCQTKDVLRPPKRKGEAL